MNTPTPRTPEGRAMASEHIEHAASRCPKCGSTDIAHGPLVRLAKSATTDTTIRRPAQCGACGEAWHDLFQLAGYDPVTRGDFIPA